MLKEGGECRFCPEIDACIDVSVEEITTERAEIQIVNLVLESIYEEKIDCHDLPGKIYHFGHDIRYQFDVAEKMLFYEF